MAYIDIKYSPATYDLMAEKIKLSLLYNDEEKVMILKMIRQMKQEQFLLYAVEIFTEDMFYFSIPDFEKYKKYLVMETYAELIKQLLKECEDYEEIHFPEIRKWFHGMTVDIDLINLLDHKFKAMGVRVCY